MATETLGESILKAARRACVLFGGENVAAFDAEWSSLRPLAARATAAERLAEAADALGLTDAVDYMRGAPEFLAAINDYRLEVRS